MGVVMELNHIIIHELKKQQNNNNADLELSLQPLSVDSKSINLVKQLNERYRKWNNTYAIFGSEAGNEFPNDFKTYHDSGTGKEFLNFSTRTSGYLKSRIEGVTLAKGGYIVFADYKVDSRNYFGIFIIRNTDGVLFKWVKDSFEIDSQVHIDFEKMAMACRINKEMYISKSERYVSFINKNDSLSDYFIKWICVEDKIDSSTDTKFLKSILTEINLKNFGDLKDLTQDEFLEKAYAVIKTFPDRNIDIKALSNQLFQDEDVILDHAEANGIEINSIFKANKNVLRSFIKVNVKAQGISLTFSPTQYKNEIKVDRNGRVIIKLPELAKKIIQEMEGNE